MVVVLALLHQLAFAAGGYEHNHPDVRWNTLETEHFYFYWPESKHERDDPHWFTTEQTAARLSTIAEESYPLITGQFDYDLQEKVHVVIYDQDRGWEGNGFALAEMDWTGFAARWGPPYRVRGRMDFLEDVFVHEFAHVVSLKAYLPWSETTVGYDIGGLAEDEEWYRRWGYKGKTGVNADVGFALPVAVHAPFYWTEGGAEYWSHKAGYNFWGTSREAFLRSSWLEDRILSIDEWTTRIDKAGFDGERGYNHGYSFGLYLHDRFDGLDMFSQMTKVSAERWHYSWDKVTKEATGETTAELYAGWRAHLDERFSKQVQEVKNRGVVAGREMALIEPSWEKDEPDKDWAKLSDKQKQEAMDGETAWVEMPSYSADGSTIAWFDRGLNVRRIKPEEWGAIGGEYVDEEDDKALKEWGKKTAYDDNAEYYKVGWHPTRNDLFVSVGPEDNAPKPMADAGLTFDADGYNWSQLRLGYVDDSKKQLKLRFKQIPNTLRAVEAAWSPDGKTIAFGRYGDGTHEIWLINPDGTNARQITDFGDSSQIQGLEWSADGRYILTSLFRNYQQDIFLLEAETSTFIQLTDSRAEETDPHFGPEGRIWFSSDPDGIFNVYSLDLPTKTVRKHTELLTGAYGSEITNDGHLLYTGFTGHGYRIFLVKNSDLKQEVVDYEGLRGVDPNACVDEAAAMAARPDLVEVRGPSKPYNAWNAQLPMTAWPILRTTDRNVEIGGDFFFGDAVEKHYLESELTFGKDNFISLSYWNNVWWPTLTLGYMRYAYKGTYGYGSDEDGNAQTTADLTVADVKFEQASDDLWLMGTYEASSYLWLGVYGEGSRYSFRDTGDGSHWAPYMDTGGVGLFVEWSPFDPWASEDSWINPRDSRRVYLDYSLRHSRLTDPEIAGTVADDGEYLDSYTYHRLMVAYTEFIPITWFGLADRHTLQLDFELGWINRNVSGWDEFMAGGRHPYNWGNGTIGNNVQFSGYEGYSLTGETMLIANGSYRFPLLRDLNWKTGPIYTEAFYLQFVGTVGNLWSYRVDGDSHLEGYSVVADSAEGIRREKPFVDYASKNSPPDHPNYLLGDIGLELRVRQYIWNDYDWDSFIRLSWGLNPTAGYGDVNADMIQSSVARDAASELSAEVEPSTLRIYAGIGTGW